jgi:hypothetical protein
MDIQTLAAEEEFHDVDNTIVLVVGTKDDKGVVSVNVRHGRVDPALEEQAYDIVKVGAFVMSADHGQCVETAGLSFASAVSQVQVQIGSL